jgi:hypothetical protein
VRVSNYCSRGVELLGELAICAEKLDAVVPRSDADTALTREHNRLTLAQWKEHLHECSLCSSTHILRELSRD